MKGGTGTNERQPLRLPTFCSQEAPTRHVTVITHVTA